MPWWEGEEGSSKWEAEEAPNFLPDGQVCNLLCSVPNYEHLSSKDFYSYTLVSDKPNSKDSFFFF